MVKKTKVVPRSAPDHVPPAPPSELLPADTELRALRLGKPGALLMRRILEEGGRRGLRKEALADASLAIKRSHFLALCNGDKDVPGLGPSSIAKAARFLRLTPIEVRLLAGQLTPSDFYVGGAESQQDALETALHTLISDPEFAPFTPPKILLADAEYKAFVVHIYERAIGKPLIPTKLTTAEVLKRYQALRQEQEGDAEASASGADFDRVMRACRSQGITLRSARLRNGSFVDALGLSLHGTAWSTDHKPLDIAKAVETFASELKSLDSVDPQPDPFTTGVVAAALLALSLDSSTLEFFERLSQTRANAGSGSLPNPIRRLLATINKTRKREPDVLREQELCSLTLQAVESWKKPDQAAAGHELSATALSGLLTRTVNRVRTLKVA